MGTYPAIVTDRDIPLDNGKRTHGDIDPESCTRVNYRALVYQLQILVGEHELCCATEIAIHFGATPTFPHIFYTPQNPHVDIDPSRPIVSNRVGSR